jgi:hypothetical protein
LKSTRVSIAKFVLNEILKKMRAVPTDASEKSVVSMKAAGALIGGLQNGAFSHIMV